MKFFREHLSDIVRLMLNQVAMAVFGLVLISATRMANKGQFGVLTLIASILSILFYMYILYATLQEMGAKHRLRVEGGRMERDTLHGMKLMVLAQIPNFVVLFLMLAGYVFTFAFRLETFGLNVYAISQTLMYFMQSMYDGVIGFLLTKTGVLMVNASNEIEFVKPVVGIIIQFAAYLVSVVPGILVCWGSYCMGLNDKKLFSFISNKKS